MAVKKTAWKPRMWREAYQALCTTAILSLHFQYKASPSVPLSLSQLFGQLNVKALLDI